MRIKQIEWDNDRFGELVVHTELKGVTTVRTYVGVSGETLDMVFDALPSGGDEIALLLSNHRFRDGR